MGAYAPAPAVTPRLMETIQQIVLNRTLKGMRKEGKMLVRTWGEDNNDDGVHDIPPSMMSIMTYEKGR
jgi:hypothetical protein